MPKANLVIELDNPKDYFEILKGEERFKDSKVDFKVKGRMLSIEIKGSSSKAVAGALGGVIKQIRIIEEASSAISGR